MSPTAQHPNIIRGKMTPAECAEIERLASTMAKPTPGKIAVKINRHPATVKWHMLTRGLIEQKPGRIPHAYTRGGKTVHPYSEAHDAFIEGLRSQGKKYREIAELATAKFGIPRNQHSIQVRLVQLAAAPDDEAAA